MGTRGVSPHPTGLAEFPVTMSEAFDTHTYRALDYLARVINNAVNLAGKT